MKLLDNLKIEAIIILVRKSAYGGKVRIYYFFIFLLSLILFWQFFLKGMIPLPADTIVGMYHPWRDVYSKEYPNGIPYNNSLITDPVRQQFVWKKLVADSFKKGELPVYNSYSFSGYPLLANFQSGVFYPLNIIFLILPLNLAWGLYIYLQFLLGGIFMFLFLRNILYKNKNPDETLLVKGSRHEKVAFLGSMVWMLSGYWTAWAEWGNILHTALWLPLILLAINKIICNSSDNSKVLTKTKNTIFWYFIYLFALLFSFFAGHLQTFFYLYLFSIFYFIFQLRTVCYPLASALPHLPTNTTHQALQAGANRTGRQRTFLTFLILNSLFLILSMVQWIPTLQFILQSARSTDIKNILARDDWFIPLKHLVQFFIPDYFGNPAKGNYFGVWNYGEFLSYIGIIPIFLSIVGIYKSIKDKTSIFWLISLSIVMIFVTKNPISMIPYQLQFPFFSTAQPSRLIFLLDFILIIFFCKEVMYFINPGMSSRHKQGSYFLIFLVFIILLVIFGILRLEHSNIILRNSIQPLVIFIIFSLVALIFQISPISLVSKISFPILFLLIFFDLSRVFWRFNTFTNQQYIFPETQITKFLENDLANGFFRISSIDTRIMPPNFSAYYKIPSIDGYDPLYYDSYANKISGDIPSSFNRIIQLNNVNAKLYDELKVKYVLTFDNLPQNKYQLVLVEGKTKLYKYLDYKPTQ